MAPSEILHALVVDDEPAIRKLTVRALRASQFDCDEAADGKEAEQLLGQRAYDVVITDLRMPRRNGHSLAVELATAENGRPLVVVLTGVLEPRLAADLIARGIDDIVFKPVDFQLFGAKIRALCDRRRQKGNCNPAALAAKASSGERSLPTLSTAEMERRLDSLAGALPTFASSHALASAIRPGSSSIDDVARLLASDPFLMVEVLRRAHDGQRQSEGRRFENLRDAIVHIGEDEIRKVAQRAPPLGAVMPSALQGLTPEVLSQRCRATASITTRLNPDARCGEAEEDLYLAALILPVTRVFQALAFSDLYDSLSAQCESTDSSLASLERSVLPLNQAQAVAGLLARWKLPPRIFKVLQHAGQPYDELAAIPEPLRTKVECLRVAELAATLAVGSIAHWEEMEFPLPQTLCRLRIHDWQRIIDEVREELVPPPEAANPRPNANHESAGVSSDCPSVNYFKLNVEPHDFLYPLLRAQHMELVRVGRGAACAAQAVLVNCLDVSAERLEWFLDDAIPSTAKPLICNAPLPRRFSCWGTRLQLPCSLKALKAVLVGAIETPQVRTGTVV